MDKVIVDFSDLESDIGRLPPNSSQHRLLRRRANEDIDRLFIDPEVEELATAPLVVPILENYEKIKEKLDPVIKEINLLKRYREKPLLFWRDELGVPIDRWREDRPPRSWKMGDPVPLWSKQKEIIKALVEHRKVAVKSGHGSGKCRYSEDLVLLADGSLVKFGSLIGKEFEVLSYDEGLFVIRKASAEDNGIKHCKKITYMDGNEEIATFEHPLWVGRKSGIRNRNGRKNGVNRYISSMGFVKVEDLNVGDCVASPIKILIIGKEVLDDDLIKFLGYMIGDGGITTNSIIFSQEKNKQLKEMRGIVEGRGCSLKYRSGYDYGISGSGGFFVKFLRGIELLGTNSHTKFIPNEVLKSTDRQIALFLSRLFSTDGWVCSRYIKRNSGNTIPCIEVGFSSVSKTIIDQVYYLLKRLGIHSNIGKRTTKCNGKRFLSFRLTIRSKEGLFLFNQKIKIFGKENKQKQAIRLLAKENGSRPKWNMENVLNGFAWNEIKDIENVEVPTVALSVDGTHTFVTPFSYEHNTFVAAGLSLYLAYVWHCIGLTTAPCFDDKTEILTDSGWKLFKNLDEKDKVAQYEPDTEEIKFVTPLEYYKIPYKGKMLGVSSQLIDFLVTPNHRCWVRPREERWGKKPFSVKFAEDIYGKGSIRFRKKVKWNGGKLREKLDWFEFLGFWFAEGYAEFNPNGRKYRVVVTQIKSENEKYIDNLFVKVGLSGKVKKDLRQNGGYNWSIYDKDLAEEFSKYGKSAKRLIPRYILDSDSDHLNAFLMAFSKGDGFVDKNGSWKLCTSSKKMADQLHEICVKLGLIANQREYVIKTGDYAGGSYYEIKIWNKRGTEPCIEKDDWYEVDYKGFVYCVKVPTQLILVRRNGIPHVSGNTFRQVRRALWGEIHYLYNGALNPLGGKLNQVSLDLGDKWFIEGFATDKPMENITGIHEENVFVIIDEAGGVADLTFEAIEGLLTSENSFVLFIGNPINAEGPFADAFKLNSKFYKISVSCYDIPNVKYANNFYSKLTSHQWVRDKEIKWGIDSNMFKVRVAGEFPNETKDTLIPIRYIEAAMKRAEDGEMTPDRVTAFGLDVARQGTDSSVYGARYASGLFRIIDVTNKKRETDTAGRMKVIYNEMVPVERELPETPEKILGVEKEKVMAPPPPKPPINVDDIGLGGGVVDMLIEDELPVNGINVGEAPDENEETKVEHPEKFLNKRAQYYWGLRNLFVEGLIAIEDEELAFELSKIRIEYLRSGKIKIVDKDILKKAPPIGIGRSPDRAECCMLACARDEADTDLEMIRFIG